MKLLLTTAWLLGALFACIHGLPMVLNSIVVPHLNKTDFVVHNSLTINGAVAPSPGSTQQDPTPGWCNFNLGLVEHFPPDPYDRRASIFIGGLWDGNGKGVNWEWDDGTPALTNGRPTERRIEYGPKRIFDFIRRGDALEFSWHHPDNNNPAHEWLEFNFNGNRWNDRDGNCGQRHCCKTGPWYPDGKDRKLRGINCGFSCP